MHGSFPGCASRMLDEVIYTLYGVQSSLQQLLPSEYKTATKITIQQYSVYPGCEFPAAEVRAGHTGWRSGPHFPRLSQKKRVTFLQEYISRILCPSTPYFTCMQSGIPDSKMPECITRALNQHETFPPRSPVHCQMRRAMRGMSLSLPSRLQ